VIIVLEGCDGAGKTTLAHKLVEIGGGLGLATDIWHRGVPQRHPLEEYEWDLEQGYPQNLEQRARTLLICDRWHMGQIVYGSIYRPGDDKGMGLGGMWHVDALLQAHGALQLVLAPPVELMEMRVRQDGDDYVKVEHLRSINAAYHVLAEQYVNSVMVLNDTVNDAQAHSLIEIARARTAHAARLMAFPTYVGPSQPDILLLGHQRNMNKSVGPRATRKAHRACFVPYRGTSGHFLCDTIVRDPQLNQQSIGIANAGEEDVAALIEALHFPAVVTLGLAARSMLEQVGITAGGVQHPQYVRRFRKDDQEQYAKAIMTAAYETTNGIVII
jgi:thymidylate kinase